MLWKAAYHTKTIRDPSVGPIALTSTNGEDGPSRPFILVAVPGPEAVREAELWRRLLDPTLGSRLPIAFGLLAWEPRDRDQADTLFPPSVQDRLYDLQSLNLEPDGRAVCLLVDSGGSVPIAMVGPATEDAYDDLAAEVCRLRPESGS